MQTVSVVIVLEYVMITLNCSGLIAITSVIICLFICGNENMPIYFVTHPKTYSEL